MGWTFYNSSGQRLSSAATNIAVLDIDGATDIGAAIVDADLFIIDDGAGGTNRKTAASRIKTYAGVTQADQAALEAETDEDTYVPPDLVKHSPGVAKAWCYIIANGTEQSPSYNVGTVGDDGTGDRNVGFTVAFSSAVYANVAGWYDIQSAGIHYFMQFQGLATGSIDIRTRDADAALVDAAHFSAHFGDQA